MSSVSYTLHYNECFISLQWQCKAISLPWTSISPPVIHYSALRRGGEWDETKRFYPILAHCNTKRLPRCLANSICFYFHDFIFDFSSLRNHPRAKSGTSLPGLSWLDYGNVLTTFHIGYVFSWRHFHHSPRAGWLCRSLASSWSLFSGFGGNTVNFNSSKKVGVRRNPACAVLRDKNVRFSRRVELAFFTAQPDD